MSTWIKTNKHVTSYSQAAEVIVTQTETSHLFNTATLPDKSHHHKIIIIYWNGILLFKFCNGNNLCQQQKYNLLTHWVNPLLRNLKFKCQ